MSKIDVKLACRKCGGALETEHEGSKRKDSDMVTCTRCKAVIGTWAQVKADAVEKARAEVTKRLRDSFKKAFR